MEEGVGKVNVIATILVAFAILILVGFAVIHGVSLAVAGATTGSEDNETLHVDSDHSTAFSIAGDDTECTLGDIFYCSEGCVELLPSQFIDLSPDCAIQATETYNNTYDDCLQQLVDTDDENDDDCYQVYTGVYSCGPPATTICEQDDAEAWYDLNWSSYFNMTSNGTIWGNVQSSWLYPLADSIDNGVWEVKYQYNSTGSPVTEQYDLSGTGCLEYPSTGFSTYVIAYENNTWALWCNNATDFVTLDSGTYDEFYLFEQEMWWDVTEEEANPFLDTEWDVNYDWESSEGNPTGETLEADIGLVVEWIPIVLIVMLGGFAVAYFSVRKQY